MVGTKARALAIFWAIGTILAIALMAQGAAAQDKAKIEALTRAYNTSGVELLQQLADAPGNIVLSPYSIGTAMAMVRSGARGETETEMSSVLKHSLARIETESASASVLAILRGYDKSREPPRCPAGMHLNDGQCEREFAGRRCFGSTRREGDKCVGGEIFPPSAKLLMANALILTTWGHLVSKDYSALLSAAYAAEVFRAAGLEQINGWVAHRTEGKIDKILERLDRDSLAVVLNAVYFKASWASPFDRKGTRHEVFNVSDSQQIQAPMMQQTGNYRLVARPGYRAIRLPYDVSALGMIIVLPDEVGGIAPLSRRLDANELFAVFAMLRAPQANKPVTLALPRFKAEFTTDLVPQLRHAGMNRPFDDQAADFSGITGQPASDVPMVISQIKHRALVEVAEEGTEGAAATAIEMAYAKSAPVAPPPEPEIFRVDHPFLFYIQDETTGAILFQGRVTNPR